MRFQSRVANLLEALECRRMLSVYALWALASLDGADGQNPQAGLIADAAGNFYGTTPNGGAVGDGAVFEVARGSGMVTTLASFDSNGSDGTNPNSGLVVDSAGNLYGTTEDGGAYGEGTVFELAQGSSAPTTLASFDETDGACPIGPLVMDAAGNLYGTAEAGGGEGSGSVFEVAKGSGRIQVLANFDGTNGASPTGGLVADAQGNLFGTTSFGGTSDDGTVFEVARGSRNITVLASFDGTNGTSPGSQVVEDAAGNLFGTANLGGANNDGTVFEVARGSGTVTALASFDGTDGSIPNSGLVLDSSGNLYGTATQGGADNDGTVFEVAPGSATVTSLSSFDGTNGADPAAGLCIDSAGNLYGTAEGGGDANGDGTIFELSITPSPTPAATPTPAPTPTPVPTPTPTPTQTASAPSPLPMGALGLSVSASLPASAVGGARSDASALVTVSNPSGKTFAGPVAVTLYLSPAKSLDGATQLLAVTPTLDLKPHARKSLRFKLSSFPSPPMGRYYLVAAVSGPEGTTGAAGPSLMMSAPFVSAIVSSVHLVPAAVKPGKEASLAFTLRDKGNVPATGTATLTVTASEDASGAGGAPVASLPLSIKLKPGAARNYQVKFAIPAALPAAHYYMTASLNVAVLGDSTAGDGVAVSSSTFTVR